MGGVDLGPDSVTPDAVTGGVSTTLGTEKDKALGLVVGGARHRGHRGKLELQQGEAPPEPDSDAGAVPRIAKLMALAIRFDGLVRRGDVADFAEIAALGHVTRARVSQIVNLMNLAPDIQEAILFHEPVRGERDAIPERQLRAIAGESDWDAQREMWRNLATPQICVQSHRC